MRRAALLLALFALPSLGTGCPKTPQEQAQEVARAVVRAQERAGSAPSATRAADPSDSENEARMTAPPSPTVEHLPPGALPAQAAASQSAEATDRGAGARQVAAQTQLTMGVPLHPDLQALDPPTVARDSETSERVSQTFHAAVPYASLVEWYAEKLPSSEWTRQAKPSLGRALELTVFRRTDGKATVEIAGVEGTARVTINEYRP